MNKQTILTDALKGRDAEVLGYQINIDNYTLALTHIATLPDAEQADLAGFRQQLEGLLASEKLEQKKAIVMQTVIRQQLEQPCNTPN